MICILNVRSKSFALILCILVLNQVIFEGLCEEKDGLPPGEREVEIEYERKKPDEDPEDNKGSGNSGNGDNDRDRDRNRDNDRDRDRDDGGGGGGANKNNVNVNVIVNVTPLPGSGAGGAGTGGGAGHGNGGGGGGGWGSDGSGGPGSGGDGGGVKAENRWINMGGNSSVSENGLPVFPLPQSGRGIVGIVGTGSMKIKKKTISGLTRALDDRCVQLDRWGDPHMGMPEDALGHLVHCAQFVYSGLYILIYTTIRYPLKLLQKAVLFTGAVQHIVTYASRCLNPISILDFAQSGRKHNNHLQKFAELKHQLKSRWIYVTDKIKHGQRQKYACCSWHEYRLLHYEAAPDIVWFTKRWFFGNYKLPFLIFCMRYQEGTSHCQEADLTILDQPPDRVVYQSWITGIWEILDKFI